MRLTWGRYPGNCLDDPDHEVSEKSMVDYRERLFPLDQRQRAAVESDTRVTLVGGSAGVGMTQVVVGRVAHLIRLDHHPTTIACLTSRGSVDVLTLRLAEHDLVAGRLLELFVGDVASLANFFLRSEGARALGISSSYSLWPPSRCIDETLARWKESGRPVVGRGDVRRALEWHWQNRSFGRLNALQNFPKPIWAEIVAIYEQAKRAQDALDHSDVLFLATDLVDIVGSGKMSVQDFPPDISPDPASGGGPGRGGHHRGGGLSA